MFGMVTFVQIGSDGATLCDAHVSPVGLEVTSRHPWGSILTRSPGGSLAAQTAPEDVRNRCKVAMEERSPILHVRGRMGDGGVDRDLEPEDFYLRISDIKFVDTRDGVLYITTYNFTVSTRHHTAEDIGKTWQMKMALLGGGRA